MSFAFVATLAKWSRRRHATPIEKPLREQLLSIERLDERGYGPR